MDATLTRLEFRHGLGKWLFLPLVALGTYAAEGQLAGAHDLWALAVSATGTSVKLMGPVAAATAAYAGGRSQRRRLAPMEALAVRGPVATLTSELSALAAWCLLAFLAVLVIVYGQTARVATWSHPDVLRTIATGLGLLLQVVLGYVAGRLVPRRFTPVAVAVALYVLLVAATSAPGGYRWGLLLPVNLNLYDNFNRLNPVVAPAQIFWYVGLASLAVAGWGLTRVATWRLWAVALCAGLTCGVAAGVVVAQDGRANEPGVDVQFRCSGADPQVCLHPAFAADAPDVGPSLLGVAARLRETPFAVSRFEQRPRGLGSAPSAGAIAFALDDTRPQSLRAIAPQAATNALGLGDSCFTSDGPKIGYGLAQLVTAWVAGDPNLFYPFTPEEKAAQDRFAHYSDEQRRELLRRRAASIRGCNLTPADF